jgi:hypothetical protein
MQPLSAPISDLLFFPYLYHFELSHQFVCFSVNGTGDFIKWNWPNRDKWIIKNSGMKFASITKVQTQGLRADGHQVSEAIGRIARPWNAGILEYWGNGAVH